MTAVPPVGPSPVDPTWPSVPVERMRERWLDDPARRDAEERRRRQRRRKPEPPGEPQSDHVDVRA